VFVCHHSLSAIRNGNVQRCSKEQVKANRVGQAGVDDAKPVSKSDVKPAPVGKQLGSSIAQQIAASKVIGELCTYIVRLCFMSMCFSKKHKKIVRKSTQCCRL
jgi:hypothetical protein